MKDIDFHGKICADNLVSIVKRSYNHNILRVHGFVVGYHSKTDPVFAAEILLSHYLALAVRECERELCT